MVEGVRAHVDGWAWDVASIGVPTPVRGGKVIAEPVNLGRDGSASTSSKRSESR